MRRVLLALAAVSLFASPAAAYDQSFCAPFRDFMTKLAQEGEVPVAAMVFGEGIVKMIFANPTTRAGTIANIGGDGVACTGVGIRGFTLDLDFAPKFGPSDDNQ